MCRERREGWRGASGVRLGDDAGAGDAAVTRGFIGVKCRVSCRVMCDTRDNDA